MRPVRRWIRKLGAAGIAVAAVLAVGAETAPSSAAATDAAGRELRLPGLDGPVRVVFTAEGPASIQAGSEHDLFLTQGYVTGRQRLVQMDLLRRSGEGRLAQLQGSAALPGDEFELQMGLLRTAQAEWAATAPHSRAGRALTAYAQGVNAWISTLTASGDWPAVFKQAGVLPAPWQPVDTLVVQELLSQQLSFSTNVLDRAVFEATLGPERTDAWFPVQPAGTQHPYDPGPYRDAGVAPLPAPNANAAASQGSAFDGATRPDAPAGRSAPATAHAAESVLTRIAGLPAGARHAYGDSNAWAVNGPAARGASVLAGDPHLAETLPSEWFEVALRAPGLEVSGASLPGVPAVLIGRNRHIAWSLTDTENQSTLFYAEVTSADHPGEYFHDGAWRPFEHLHYTIPVAGGADVPFDVALSAHGPVLTQDGRTLSVFWMGDLPSANLDAVLGIDSAASGKEFTSALRGWVSPTQNFVYADDRGNIGAISPGGYPIVRGGQPMLPLAGDGSSDVVGIIPFTAVPQVYNPPGHSVATANQRPVGPDYPYYIGTSMDFDPGYRVGRIDDVLGTGGRRFGMAETADLQTGYADGLAPVIVPRLLSALKAAGPGAASGPGADAAVLLAGWDGSMTVSSAAATVWATFWNQYVSTVFQPWWDVSGVPAGLDGGLYDPANAPGPLETVLEQWTLHDPDNAAFTPPGSAPRDAASAMRAAFGAAVASLSDRLGPDPSTWTWGRVHQRVLPSLLGVAALDYGPFPAGGDPRTVNAADGGLVSSFGPTWRMVVSWSGPGRATAEAVYPGGQSEDPASEWYANLAPVWWEGRYLPLVDAGARGKTWLLR